MLCQSLEYRKQLRTYRTSPTGLISSLPLHHHHRGKLLAPFTNPKETNNLSENRTCRLALARRQTTLQLLKLVEWKNNNNNITSEKKSTVTTSAVLPHHFDGGAREKSDQRVAPSTMIWATSKWGHVTRLFPIIAIKRSVEQQRHVSIIILKRYFNLKTKRENCNAAIQWLRNDVERIAKVTFPLFILLRHQVASPYNT